jgi:HAD superfamily hydrolase (TIGR01509 family)
VPALIFDCDGVLADTERYGHLPAFNETFAAFGIPVRWTDAEYAEKVLIGGGKERMASILTPEFVAANGLPTDPAERTAMLAEWHKHKTASYTSMVAAGAMPARPGIARIVEEAAAAGWQLAVASTSAEPAVRAVLEHAVGADRARDFAVFAGDIVPAKKPDPAIYRLAVKELALQPNQAVVIEDSSNGLRAALGTGLACVVTVSTYTADEDFTGAALVVSNLGDPDGEQSTVLADPLGIRPGGSVRLADLSKVLERWRPGGPVPGDQQAHEADPVKEN